MAKEARDARIQEGSWRKGPERVIGGARAVATTRGLSSFRRLKHCVKPLAVSA